MVNKLKDAANFLKTKFQSDELDQKLSESVSQENWQASTQLLHQIANAAFNNQKEKRIFQFAIQKLKNKSWKKVLKALHLIDFLIKNGPTTIVNNFRENVYQFRVLQDFVFHSEGIDRGQSIRKQAKSIINILSDQQYLNDERIKAKNIKQKMAHVIGGGVYYGSYSSSGKSNDNYNAISSNATNNYFGSSKYTPSTNGGTFGQMVMKQLHQKKNIQQIKSTNVPKQAPTSQLNLSKMNIKKPENKSNKQIDFNDLSKKLHKPQEKPSIVPPSKIQKKPNSPQPQNNIFNIDLSVPNTYINTNNSTKNNNSNLMDFLGDNNTAQNISNFGFSTSKPYQQKQKVQMNYMNSFSYQQNIPKKQQIQNPIKIQLNIAQKPKQNHDLNDLIDFSDFKTQLNAIKVAPNSANNNITQNWNW